MPELPTPPEPPEQHVAPFVPAVEPVVAETVTVARQAGTGTAASPLAGLQVESVCADLRISSIVDVPNWVVSMYFPRIVLE